MHDLLSSLMGLDLHLIWDCHTYRIYCALGDVLQGKMGVLVQMLWESSGESVARPPLANSVIGTVRRTRTERRNHAV